MITFDVGIPCSAMIVVEGYGYDRSVLAGKVWRTLPYSDDTAATVAAAKAISADGGVPCVSPQPLIKAGVKASELAEVSQ